MKKTKLFTSLAALALVLGLGACETTSEEDVTPSESESTSQTTEGSGSDSGTTSDTGTEEEPVTLPEGAYRLGVADTLETTNDLTYRYFVTIDNGALTSTNWNEGADVYVDANTDGEGYALRYVEEETLYIGYNGSGTALVSKSEPYYWAYDSENAVFVDTIEETVEDEKDDDGNVISYKASGRFIGMQEGYEYLRAYATSNLTSDTYYGATLYSEYPGILEAPVVEEPEITPTPAPEVGEYFLGFDVNGTVNYIDGGTVPGYDREGTLTTNIGYAVPVTLAAAEGDNAYYLTFDLDGTTNYICIVNVDTYVNLQYLTTPTPIYWDETYAAWVNEEDTYFLCYNSTYKCAYASAFADWWGSSPVGELFDIPEGWEPETPSTDVLSIADLRAAITAGEVTDSSGAVTFYGKIVARRDESNIYNGVYLQDGEDAVMLYSGSLSSLWTSESLSLGDDVLVTATYSSYNGLSELLPSKIEKIDGNEYGITDPVTWTPTSSEWLAASESCSGRLTTLDLIYNGGTISTTANTSLTMKFNDDESKEATVYFYSNMGSTYLEEVKAVFDDLVVGDHIKLTGVVAWFNGIQLAPHYIYNIENNADCLEVLNTAAPTSITITGADEVNVGFSTTLEAVLTGENYDQHVVWTSSSEAATVDENGKVTGNYAETGVTITATSRVNASVYGTKTINVVELSTGVQVQDTLDKTANDLGTEFTRSDGSAYTFGSNNGSQTDYIEDGTIFEYTYISFTWNNGSASTGTRFWSATPNQIRIYPNAYFTISTNNGATLDKIVITCASSSGNASHLSIDSGAGQLSVSSNVVTITPADGSTSITIKEAGDSSHCRMQEFAITYTYTV